MSVIPSASPEADVRAPNWKIDGRIPSLDGLRTVAILLVSLAHFAPATNSPLPKWFEGARFLGAPAVDLFFVISGFLITTLLLSEKARTQTVSLKQFYMRRALRILPAYALFLLVLFALTRFGVASMSGNAWALALTYTVNFVPVPPDWIGHVWSLSVEEHFYLAWPLALVMLGTRRSVAVLLACLVAAPILRYVVWFHYRDLLDGGLFTLTRVDTLAAGCLLAFWMRDPRSVAMSYRIRSRTSLLILVSAAFVVVSVFILSHSGKYSLFLGNGLQAVAMAIIVFAAVANPNAIICRFLNWAPITAIGVLSYSLYLYQPFMRPATSHWPQSWEFNWVAMIGAAIASYFLVERPFLKLKSRLTSNAPKKNHPETQPALRVVVESL